jgi:hypothetical protein
MDMRMRATSEGMDREEPPKEILFAYVSGRLRVMKDGRGFKDRKFPTCNFEITSHITIYSFIF